MSYQQPEQFYASDQTLPPQKSYVAVWLFSYLLGSLGIDRFYLGKIGTAVLKLVTLGGFGIWALYDLIITLMGKQTDKWGRTLQGYEENKKMSWWVTGILFTVGILFSTIFGVMSANVGM